MAHHALIVINVFNYEQVFLLVFHSVGRTLHLIFYCVDLPQSGFDILKSVQKLSKIL